MLQIEKLSEKNLAYVLKAVYPQGIITGQKRIKILDRLLIVDYEVIYNNQVIYVEFDGPTHYTNSKTQARDILLEEHCEIYNIKLIRIPYFIQLDDSTIDAYFTHLSYGCILVSSTYTSGFHDTKIIYPGNFNSYGWELFWKQYEQWLKGEADRWDVMRAIWHSLIDNKDIEVTIGVDWKTIESKYIFVTQYPT